MIEREQALAINRAGWDKVAPLFHGGTALPEFGPLALTEDALQLVGVQPGWRVLELGCGSGHSLKYLADRGASELWGLDLSPVQISYARDTLSQYAAHTHLFESAMEVDPGIPFGYFDLVFSIYGVGWTTDLPGTLGLAARYLRPGGSFVLSGEHPAYSCVEWNGREYVVAEPCAAEGPREYESWRGVRIVIQRRTLATFVTEIARAGLRIESLVESPANPDLAKEAAQDPSRWYSMPRARLVPTTFVINARKPVE
jgi:ubiquinone/menaquinone biosynthesis C-methylase UbiE